MLNGAKPLSNNVTTIAGLKKAKEKAIKWSTEIGKGPYKNNSEKNIAPKKILKRTTKPHRRRILIEEGLAKSSKKQHSENTDRTQTSGIFVKRVAEMLTRTKPQKELGTRRCMNPRPHTHTKRKHSELKEPYEMLNKAKTLTTIFS